MTVHLMVQVRFNMQVVVLQQLLRPGNGQQEHGGHVALHVDEGQNIEA